MVYTKEEFKAKWDSNEDKGGVTFKDMADCAKAWGLYDTRRIVCMQDIAYAVLFAAKCESQPTNTNNNDKDLLE